MSSSNAYQNPFPPSPLWEEITLQLVRRRHEASPVHCVANYYSMFLYHKDSILGFFSNKTHGCVSGLIESLKSISDTWNNSFAGSRQLWEATLAKKFKQKSSKNSHVQWRQKSLLSERGPILK